MLDSLQLSPWPATAVVALFAITLAAIAHRIVALILRRATSPLPVVHTRHAGLAAADRAAAGVAGRQR